VKEKFLRSKEEILEVKREAVDDRYSPERVGEVDFGVGVLDPVPLVSLPIGVHSAIDVRSSVVFEILKASASPSHEKSSIGIAT
jgi:hypothetical protein